jgi:hypothetical protein
MPDLLSRLATLNRTGVFLAALVVSLIGLFLPGALGAVVLYATVALLSLLLARTFPHTAPGGLALRVLVLLVLATIATAKLVG